MRLRRNQLCPIHRSIVCCGREPILKKRRARQMGVWRINDPQHPRGYREIRSNLEMRKLMNRKIAAQDGACALCKGQFTDYNDIVPDHINPRWNGRSVERRSFRQYPGRPLVVQRREGNQPCDQGARNRVYRNVLRPSSKYLQAAQLASRLGF